MADYGLKIAQPGYDVETATLQQIAFSSQYPIFKMVISGNFTFTLFGGNGTDPTNTYGTVSHNLGYYPAFRTFSYIDANKTKRSLLDSNYNPIYLYARCGTNNLILFGQNYGTSNFTATIYYYIYADAGG